MKKILTSCLYVYLILSIGLTWTVPIYAQEATNSAQEILSLAQDVVEAFHIPKMPLPFDGKFKVSQEFGKNGQVEVVFDLEDVNIAVKSIDEGEVVKIEEVGTEKTLTVSHKWGESIYSHLHQVTVATGDKITQSQVVGHSIIGTVTLSMKAKIPPLDHINGYVNPLPYIPDSAKEDIDIAKMIEEEGSKILGVSEENTTGIKIDDVSANNDFLYSYKADLQEGINAHFFEKSTKAAGFAILDSINDLKLKFSLKQNQEASSSVKVKGNQIEYAVLLQDIPMTLRYTVAEGQIKEEFIIENKPSDEILQKIGESLNIPFDVKTEGLKGEQNGSQYDFKQINGSVYWTVLPPTMVDKDGKNGDDQISIDFKDESANLNVRTEFLKSASFPVVIDPTVVIGNSSSATAGTDPNYQRHIVRTSDGSLHAFIQQGTVTQSAGDTNCPSKNGLLYFKSTDGGTTWNCMAQIAAHNGNATYVASAATDSSDNIYVVRAAAGSGASATGLFDVFYTKLTKDSGSNWTVGTEYTVLDDVANTTAYTNATIIAQDTTRLWLAVRYFDGTNYQVQAYYSNGMNPTAAGNWTVSSSALDTPDTNTSMHLPNIVRYGSKIGIIYNHLTPDGSTNRYFWKFRADSDGLTSWSTEGFISSGTTTALYSAVGDSSGHVYLTVNNGTTVSLFYYNSIVWNGGATVSTTAASNAMVSVATDGVNAWVFYGDTSGLSSALSGSRKLVYKKAFFPFDSAHVDATATPVVSYEDIFDKVWLYDGSTYQDLTTAAGNTTAADVFHTTTNALVKTTSSDVAYFGKTTTFDAISWALSTNGDSGGSVTWEYCSAATNSICDTWSALTFTSSTSTAASNFRASGYGAFTAPNDWVAVKTNGEGTAYYYIRARVTATFSTTAPIGTQMAAIPQINRVNVAPLVASNGIYAIWSENATANAKIRFATISVTPDSASSAIQELTPVIGYSTTTNSTQASPQRNFVITSDGTWHMFMQAGTKMACNGSTGSNNTYGLIWIYSSDSGATWNCGGQLSSDTTNSMQAAVVADSNNDIHVVYSVNTGTGTGTAIDGFYRKLTKSGSNWTVGAAITIFDSASSSTGYTYVNIALAESSTNKLWVTARYNDGSNWQIPVKYTTTLSPSNSGDFSESVSSLTSGSPGNSATSHIPVMVRFGSNIGVIYRDIVVTATVWRYRADSDAVGTWATQATVIPTSDGGNNNTASMSAAGDSSGRVYFTMSGSNVIKFYYYNATSWSNPLGFGNNVATTRAASSSVATDGNSVWIIYGDATGINSGAASFSRMSYKRGNPPFASSNFSDAVPFVSWQGVFDQVWSYNSGAYTDVTSSASSTTSSDTQMVSTTGDIIYFGKTTKFDSIEWDLSTDGTTGVVAWEYYNGSSWVPLTGAMESFSSNFTADGYLGFIPNTDWSTTAVNGATYYYIRARVITSYSVTPVGAQMLALPATSWGSAIPTVSNHTLYSAWTSGANNPARIMGASFNVNATPTVSELGPSQFISGGYTTTNNPTLTFNLADADSADTVKYQIQIDDTADFSSTLVNYTSALASQGSTSFTVGQAAGSGTYSVGSQGQTLSDGSYYWRVKAIDSTGVESSYSTANSGSIAFKVDTTAPTTPGTPTTSSPTTNTTPTWTWTASSDSGSGLASPPYTVQWSTDSSFGSITGSSTSSTTSFTQPTALANGTWYFRVKATDVAGNSSSYATGSVVIDTVSPISLNLNSPGNNSFVNNPRPTFQWSAATDATSGIAKYVLGISNRDGQYILIDNIPPSGTSNYETSQYTVQYQGFSDSDSTNNTISVYTKSSSNWPTPANDGQLTSGYNNWTVWAVDNVGNSTNSGWVVYGDFAAPQISNLTIQNVGLANGYYITTNLNPKLSGTINDDFAPTSFTYTFFKQSYFLGIEVSQDQIISQTVSLNNTQEESQMSFVFYPGQNLPYGKYTVEVYGTDIAGNNSQVQSLDFQVLTPQDAQKLLETALPGGNKDKSLSIVELEKKAQLRREKEAAELAKFLAELKLESDRFIAWMGFVIVKLPNDTLAFFGEVRVATTSALSSLESDFNKRFPNIAFLSNNPLVASIKRFNQPFNQSESQTRTEIVTNQSKINKNISKIAGGINYQIGNVNSYISQAQNDTQTKLNEYNQTSNGRLDQISSGINLALNSAIKSSREVNNFKDKVFIGAKVASSTFSSYVFNDDQTRITDVTIEELGRDYIVISWQTNHFTTHNKINYGTSLSYDKEMWATDGEKYHVVKITGLEPQTRYFFEVMSQNKEYVYDAYYSFETNQ